MPAIGIGIGIPFRNKGILWWDAHGKVLSGKLLSTDFDSITDWNNDGTFSKVADDALIVFNPLPIFFSGTINGDDRTGVRESYIMIVDNTMYLTYVGGDNSTGWYVQLAHSTDGGKTWTKDGIIGPPDRDDGEGGNWPAVDNLTWYKEDGILYMYRMTSDTVGPAPYTDVCYGPFRSDIWTALSFAGPWTFIGKINGVPASTWAKDRILAGGIIKIGATYYFFVQASGSLADYFPLYFGVWSSNTPIGPWTIHDPPFMSTAILGDGRLPENPRPWYHPTLGKYCCVGNLSNDTPSFFAEQNCLQISSDVLFTTNSLRRIQHTVFEMDNPSNRTLGLMNPIKTDDNEIIIGNNGFLPVTFDGDGLIQAIDYHVGKCIKFAMLEPSRNTLRFDGSALGTIYYALPNTDFIAEFGVQFDAYTIGDYLSFLFRSDGIGQNDYRLQLANGTRVSSLIKFIAGEGYLVQSGTSTDSRKFLVGMINRIKLIVNGTSIKAYINGLLIIDATDVSFVSGTHIGFLGTFTGAGNYVDVRLLSIRTLDIVTLNDLPVGIDVDLRGDGGVTAQSTVSNNLGIAKFTLNHWPMDSFYIEDINYPVIGGIWGGDEYSFANLSFTGYTPNPSLGATKLLLHLNNNVTDSSLVPKTVTNVGGVTFATTGGKFSYYAAFNAGQYLTIPDDADFGLGSDDWTLDFWICPTTLSGTNWYFICGQGNAALDANTRQLGVWIEGTSSLRSLSFGLWDNASTYMPSTSGITTMVVNTWYHIAIIRNGNMAIGYLNGRAECYVDVTGKTLQHPSGVFVIGRMGLYTSSTYRGRVDEFRLTKGIARWTRDFTPELIEYDPDI